MNKQNPIVIVGAGYSGTLTAVNLLREIRDPQQKIILIDSQTPFGRGLAYDCWDDNLLLNVPAGNMSALANEPDHFLEYCSSIDPAFTAGSFISRRIYGEYLEHTLAQAEQNGVADLQKLQAEAVAVKPQADGGFRVELADGAHIDASHVVLALGHFPPRSPFKDLDVFSPNTYIQNPWDFHAMDQISPESPVLILGCGHTAIDALFRLSNGKTRRKVYLLSRRGLLPHPHRFTPKSPAATGFPQYLETIPVTIRAYLRALRQQASAKQESGGDWRDAINELRPHIPELWQRFSLEERRKFLTKIVAYWDVHRHRLAPSTHQRLNRMLSAGQAELIAGRALEFVPDNDMVKVSIRQKKDAATRILNVGAIVNCTGPNYDLGLVTQPLIAQLRDNGLLTQDPLKIGIEVDTQYRPINKQGTPTTRLYYVGPMLKAKYWEATAIPELRRHTLQLAKQIETD